MAAIAHVVVDLLTKNELTSEDKFSLLITDVPYNMAVGQPPLKPARTENVLVDKEVAGVDWLHTSCGSWRVKNQTLRLFRPTTANGWINRQLSQLEFKTGVDGEGYIMKTKYFHHSNYVKVKRTTTEMVKILGDHKQENTTYGLIQYNFPDDVKNISPKKRKGCAPSCKMMIKESVKSSAGPRTIASKLSDSLLQHNVPGTIPRSIDQIKYFRKKLNNASKVNDEYNEILLYATANEIGKKSIHNLQFNSRGVRFTYALSPQIEEIISTCTQHDSSCGVLCIDTFKTGDFFTTPTCYYLPQFINPVTKRNVIMPGPCLFHTEDERWEVYLNFAHTLIEMDTNIDKVRFVGGDRGRGQRGFLYPLRSAVLVPCTRHIEHNIREQIKDGDIFKQIKKDIFGSKTKSGLIDSKRVEFDSRLAELCKKWPLEFCKYFKTFVQDDMKECMLSDVRDAIGLGKELFYNNGLECLNKKIKTKKREYQILNSSGPPISKSCTLFEAVRLYHDLIIEERHFLHQAMIGGGPYQLFADYQHLLVNEIEFCSKTVDEKRQILLQTDKFMKDGFEMMSPGDLFNNRPI